MDKSWITVDRRSTQFSQGVEEFLSFSVRNAVDCNAIRCPCTKCGNMELHSVKTIRGHIYWHGFDTNYHRWIWHGESCEDGVGTSSQFENLDVESVEDDSGSEEAANVGEDDGSEEAANVAFNNIDMTHAAFDNFDDDPILPNNFASLLEDAEKPLYPGCAKFTKLSALVKLYNLKAKYGYSDRSFDALLKLLSELLPTDNVLPTSMYSVKKTLSALGMEYKKIHACPNNCILFRKQYEENGECPQCGTSRWKIGDDGLVTNIPAKVLWYFPPIPRFKRMFRSAATAKNLIWHANEKKSVRGKLQHPSDSPTWKLVDCLWPDFAAEDRNLRLGIGADGMNPHSLQSSKYSCWPVITVVYNLPPWLCMKRKFMMLTLLISGPKQPGNRIDVYLDPLIEDLKKLWDEGVRAFDAYRREEFTLRAVLLWTINDFPAYGNLSGHAVKGYYACPVCSEHTFANYLKHGRKMSFVGHRRFLPLNHPYRRQKKAFNGFQEFGVPPIPSNGVEILAKLNAIDFDILTKGKNNCTPDECCWKKKSIFFELEYWKSLYVRHNLDVMHIEKNVCESLVGTLLNIPGKSKDGVNARLDLVELGLRTDLAPVVHGKRTFLPPACYTLSKQEKKLFCSCLAGLKVPDGYSSNFKNLVNMDSLKLVGMKSHECHALMQQILPVAIRHTLPKNVRHAIARLCFFFNAICKKSIDVANLDAVQNDLIKTLCLLEKFFPPSFFDVMVHLTVHLIREVRLCGPVHFRWMYPFERYMKILKSYVRNKTHPEGCIAENYIAEEAIEFCSEYQKGLDAIGNPLGRYQKSHDKEDVGAPIKGGKSHSINQQLWEQVHRYVLANVPEVQPYKRYVYYACNKV
jgi:hypothetical protein